MTENIFNTPLLNGLMNGEVYIQNKAGVHAIGSVSVLKTELINDHLIKKTADYFQVSPNQLISFDRIFSRLAYDGKNVKFPGIKLQSKDFTLKGSLVFKEDMFMNSQCSIFLTKKFMQNSKYLRPTVSFFKTKDPIRFDLKISGYASSLNFQWVDSDSKGKIQKHIPDFIERIVEDRVEQSFNKTSVN